jgi:hypothetical protein
MPKKPILFIFIFLFALLIANFAFGFEVKYPNIPGVGTPENCAPKECLGQYVAYWFTFGIYIAGVLALISLAIGGIQIITSAGNPEAMGNAKDRIKGAVLGLVLLLGSVIILRTINPQFIEPTITPLPGVAGIFLQKGTDELSPAPQSISDVSIFPAIQEGYNKLFYKCSEDGGGDGPTLLIWKFPKQGFQGNDNNYSGVQVVRKNCGESESIGNSGSYQIAFESPGVYYFLEDGCNGHMSSVNVASQDRIQEPFLGRIKSVRIINNPDGDIFFGTIFRNSQGLDRTGRCTYPLLYRDQEFCMNINIPTISVNIFKWEKDPIKTGTGVSFYSEPYGWNVGSRSGLALIKTENISPFYKNNSTQLLYSHQTRNPRPAEYRSFCKNFKNCPGSVKLGGNYLLGIYSNFQGLCQIFTKDIPNFFTTELIARNISFDEVIIIPIKK